MSSEVPKGFEVSLSFSTSDSTLPSLPEDYKSPSPPSASATFLYDPRQSSGSYSYDESQAEDSKDLDTIGLRIPADGVGRARSSSESFAVGEEEPPCDDFELLSIPDEKSFHKTKPALEKHSRKTPTFNSDRRRPLYTRTTRAISLKPPPNYRKEHVNDPPTRVNLTRLHPAYRPPDRGSAKALTATVI